jgi:alpha-amylase
MGFDAIWISPIPKNYPGSYHGYHAVNFSDYNENFGSIKDLKNLVDVCHSRGIWIMLDIVGNHAGPVGMDFSQIYPFNKEEHYHTYCEITD